MTTKELLHIVQSQLATDLNCTPDDLNGEKDSFVFTETKENPGRRPFPRNTQHFEMLTMGMSIVVSASPDILRIVKPLLDGKSRDEAFSMPFVYGHSLYYLPDLDVYEYLKYLLEEMPNNNHLLEPKILGKYLPWSDELPDQCRLKRTHKKCFNK